MLEPTLFSKVTGSLEAIAYSINHEISGPMTWINLRDHNGMYCGYIAVPANMVNHWNIRP